MIYHYREPSEAFEALEEFNVHEVAEHGVLQWHKDDYTLVAEASYEVAGTYDKAKRVFEGERRLENADVDDARMMAMGATDKPVIGESDQDGIVRFFAMWDARDANRPGSFPDEATELVEAFVNCVITIEESRGTPEHEALVVGFLGALDGFLSAYKGLTNDDIARYIAAVGVSKEKAERDLAFIRSLYA